MATVRTIPKAEAQNVRKAREPGVRKQRMNSFDEYVKLMQANPGQALVFEDIGESPQKFILTLRAAFKRAKIDAVVRKMRGRDEIRAWHKIEDAEDSDTQNVNLSAHTGPVSSGETPGDPTVEEGDDAPKYEPPLPFAQTQETENAEAAAAEARGRKRKSA